MYDSLVYRGFSTYNGDSTTPSFANCDIGAESAKRAVHVTLFVQFDAFSSPTVNMSIGAVSATRIASYIDYSSGAGVIMFVARVPTGTQATISLNTGSSASRRCAIAWYTFNPDSISPIDFDAVSDFNTSVSLSALSVINGGALFVGSTVVTDNTLTVGYSGGDALTSDVALTELEAAGFFGTAHHAVTTEDASRNLTNTGTGTARRTVMGVAYGLEYNLTPVVTDTAGVGESFDLSASSYSTEAVDEINARDRLGELYQEEAVDGTGLGEVLIYGRPVTATDAIRIARVLTYAPVINVTETIGIDDVSVTVYALAGGIAETLKLQTSTGVECNFYYVHVDVIGINDSYLLGIPKTVTETVGVQLVASVVRALKIVESLRIAPQIAGVFTYGKTLTDRVRLMDALKKFLSADADEVIGIALALAAKKNMAPALTSTVGVADALAHKLVFHVTLPDELEITDEQLLHMIFAPVVADGVEITAGYLSPGGGFTTWAINTRTAAVTEYDNYVFNSFAQLGHKYVGATSDGLYELNGGDDNGTDIIARIKSGFAQFGGSRFTSFKAAYLGMRGTGDFVLKLETGDGKTYTYAAVAKNMETARVHMGKGLRARYFAFELISTGQDFDLDSVEFMPLVVQRRV